MDKMYFSQLDMLWSVFSDIPNATAYIRGSDKYPQIRGVAQFYQQLYGVLMVVEVMGLPPKKDGCKGGVHGLHIHEGRTCDGDEKAPFANTGTHYNPTGCDHPYHAGDLPPLFENQGYGMTVFFTDRFKVSDVIGKTIVVHAKIDDFSTQPAGNAGEKIACGEIIPIVLK